MKSRDEVEGSTHKSNKAATVFYRLEQIIQLKRESQIPAGWRDAYLKCISPIEQSTKPI